MPHPLGLIHGRFQVLHNDHLKYLLAGKALCDRLIVGVTNPDESSTTDEPSDPHRSDARNNPLTYAEREAMIRAALTEAGVPKTDFDVIPFPICKPEQVAAIAPRDAVYYLTIYDDWGPGKTEPFQGAGTDHPRHVGAAPVPKGPWPARTCAGPSAKGAKYRSIVPPAVADMVEKWNLQERFSGTSPSGS